MSHCLSSNHPNREPAGGVTKKRFLVSIAICFTLGAGVAGGARASSISVGENIGKLEAVLSDGRPIPFDYAPGQVTVIMFGASWCTPCGPLKAKMEGEYGRAVAARSSRVKFVYLQVDNEYIAARKTPAELDNHFWWASVDKSKFKSPPNPVNPKFWSGGSWYTSNLPNLLAVDANGVVLAKGRGYELEGVTEQTLKLLDAGR